MLEKDKWEGFKYCPETGDLFRNFKSGSVPAGLLSGKSHGYIRFTHNKKSYLGHRVAYEIMTGRKIGPRLQIDHINGVKDDNRWENLRIVNCRENGQNLKIHRNGRLVGASASRGKFRSSVMIEGKPMDLGGFDTEEDASRAYFQALEDHKKGIPITIKKIGFKGAVNGNAKLTESDVLEIRSILSGGKRTMVEIGLQFGVSHAAISAIKRRKAWAHIK